MAVREPLTEITPSHKRGIWLTVAALLVFVVVLLCGFVYSMTRPHVLSDAQLRANNAYLFPQPRDIGNFSLVDDNGQAFVPDQLRGKWSLLYFGFTYCPDLCPTTMAQLSQFYSRLKPRYAKDTQVIMVSVDPARDTPAKLHDYVRYFNPGFRGVTGEFMALQQFATSVNAPFVKVPGAGDNYQVEHSGNIVLIGPHGHYLGFFKAPQNVDKLLENYSSIRINRG